MSIHVELVAHHAGLRAPAAVARADAQLAVVVAPPALEPAVARAGVGEDGAERVVVDRGDGFDLEGPPSRAAEIDRSAGRRPSSQACRRAARHRRSRSRPGSGSPQHLIMPSFSSAQLAELPGASATARRPLPRSSDRQRVAHRADAVAAGERVADAELAEASSRPSTSPRRPRASRRCARSPRRSRRRAGRRRGRRCSSRADRRRRGARAGRRRCHPSSGRRPRRRSRRCDRRRRRARPRRGRRRRRRGAAAWTAVAPSRRARGRRARARTACGARSFARPPDGEA